MICQKAACEPAMAHTYRKNAQRPDRALSQSRRRAGRRAEEGPRFMISSMHGNSNYSRSVQQLKGEVVGLKDLGQLVVDVGVQSLAIAQVLVDCVGARVSAEHSTDDREADDKLELGVRRH